MAAWRDLFVFTTVFGLLPFVLARPDIGILLWTWIGLMNPHRLAWGVARDFPFALIVGVTTMIAIVLWREPKRLPLSAPVVVLLLFCVWMVITTFGFAIFPQEALEKFDKVWKVQLFIFLTMVVMNTEQRIRWLVLVATLSIAFYGIKGGVYTILQGGGGMVLGPDSSWIAGNTEIALALVVTLPLMRWLQLQTQKVWLKRAATVSMILMAVSILGSYSRGGLLALAAMAIFLWLKMPRKLGAGIVLITLATMFLAFMPQEWYARMQTIEAYEEDASASARLGAWKFAWNVAKAHPVTGGGFDVFQGSAFAIYAPDTAPYDSHSIWFSVLAEHGFAGFFLWLLFWYLVWRTCKRTMRLARGHPEFKWARDLAAMIQVGLVGYFVGGTFLSLAYWDYPYILAATAVLTRVVVERGLRDAAVKAKAGLPRPGAPAPAGPSPAPAPALRAQAR
jgi:probable O-glycosylation ligase (exosortase A-associated)